MKQEKLILLFLLCLLSDTLCAKVQTDELCRQSINFNRNWKYMQGDYTGAERTDYDDSSWETIGIPHSFSIPYFMSKDFYTGYGWYRKSFELTAKDLKQQLFVEFDGVFQEAEVFVNGKKAGTHTGGYTGFYFDISSAVRMGNNVIAVRVNNIWKANVAPRAGEHVFSGGIYRNVRLVRKSPVHIDWYGIFATTPDLAAHQGKSSVVRVCTDICNKTNKTMEFKLLTEVKDAEGRILVSVENEEKVEANSMKKLEQITEAVNHPTLWHPRHPYLYKVVSSVYQGQMLIDRVETPFGFRWFEWYPYVWGGSSPATSFDCSGYVSWVINHSGWNVGRLGAQGLYNICTPTSSPKPGDLVFFKGTYDTPGVSHCGIYVGDGKMLHCGDPIGYANLNTSYWQSHFYAYGRLP